MEDKTQSNQVEEATINRTKAPQKVEVVVANSSSGAEVNPWRTIHLCLKNWFLCFDDSSWFRETARSTRFC